MIFEKLLKLEEELNPIRIGSHGAGWMGSGFVTQVNLIKGMVVSCLADETRRKPIMPIYPPEVKNLTLLEDIHFMVSSRNMKQQNLSVLCQSVLHQALN